MNTRMWQLLVVAAVSLLSAAARGQESVRELTGPGQFGKFLTHGQLDRWVFDGEAGETIIAYVASREFDPILELAKDDGKDDAVLLEVDDPGSEGRLSIRLPEKGKYKIRVHAFQFQGGGNYTLRVQRFHATPLAVGKPVIGTFDREGKSYHYFAGEKDQILIPELKGTAHDAWTVLNTQGSSLENWSGSVLVEKAGECYLVVTGRPDYRYDLLVREARQQDLPDDDNREAALVQGEMDVWNLQGKPGDFRLVDIEKRGELRARLIYAPPDRTSEQRIAQPGDRPEIEFLPVAGRGNHLRFAAVLGREGRYQIQLLAATAASYKLIVRDPSAPIEWAQAVEGNLPVGGAGFYSVRAVPGQLLKADLTAAQFVPVLRLYDASGELVRSSDDDADALEGRITHMIEKEGLYRFQVSSLGNGGGGDFRLALEQTELKELQIGGRGEGTSQPGAIDYWAFSGEAEKIVFLNVRSSDFEPRVSLRSPDGVRLAADSEGGTVTGSLLAVKLPKTGQYTVWVSSGGGAGDYTVRLIDGE